MDELKEQVQCQSHFNLDDRNGRLNLIKAFREQRLLRNMEGQQTAAEAFAAVAQIHGCQPGKNVYDQHEFGNNQLYFVLSGEVSLFIHFKLIAEVKAGECFGEFPILDSSIKYTVTAQPRTECCIAKIHEEDLRSIAKRHPEVWLNMSKMLVGRLQATNERLSSGEPRLKPKVFVGSSSEGLGIAESIQKALSQDYEVVVWNQGPFELLGTSYLESLEAAVNQFDFGVFVFSPDDKIESRGKTGAIARDNVIFELGMFIGKLSRRRAFLVYPKNLDVKILSDFDGIVMGGYESSEKQLSTALAPVCDQIKISINTAMTIR